ncbi:TPA: hypothetical protein SIE94_001272 [Escherichia coli]|uniref:hypothetical protein n=1 Tax=Escherichia coli TaxID=562 RepID=UPI0015C58316|nr:hypothetical protein [Escherichia coli]HBK1299357.1 hypothetical protein [Escherichia coli]HEI0406772.1 hypothetical protein [Escherichia coli]
MLNLDQLLKSAPAMPTSTGSWASVYLEPMVGSGERLTVIVAVVTSSGDVLVKPAIRKEVIEAMYGFRASSFNRMIEVISNSLQYHLENNKNFSGWVPPISGITLSTPRQAVSASVTGILRQAVALSSSLSSLLEIENNHVKKRSSNSREKDRWSTQLLDAVINKDNRRNIFFNRQFSFSDGHRPAKIFYLSDHAAINTGKLLPHNLTEQVKDGKAKISDLSMIKKHGDIFPRDTHKLIIYKPEDDNPAYTDKNIASIKSAFLALQDLAYTYDISITAVNSVEQAASIILNTAA